MTALGPEHPEALTARNNLAFGTGLAGDPGGACDQVVALLPVCERVLGPEHPDTLLTRANLARWTGTTGNPAGARDQLAALVLTAPLSGYQVMINGYALCSLLSFVCGCDPVGPEPRSIWVERPQRCQQLPQFAGPRVIKIPTPLAGPRSGIGLPGVLVAVLTGTTLLLVAA
jgi:hypothetical protein